MKIIGHRGAAGLALENTISGFEIATLLGVDAIELDIRLTKDGQIVVAHDSDLKRISNSTLSIKNSTLRDLQKIKLSDNKSVVPTLSEVIKVTGRTPLIIEIKSEGCLEPLLEILNKHPELPVTVISFKHNELAKLRSLAPKLSIYGSERTRPIDIIQLTRSLKLNGVCLNYWLLNPLTYWMCRRYKLELFVYTVNSRLIGKIIQTLYPAVGICTDYPEIFLKNAYPLQKTPKKNRKS